MGKMRDILGPSKNEVWENFCKEIGADFKDEGIWKGSKVESKFGEWHIILDTYTVSTGKTHTTYTRMRAPFINNEGFFFRIHRSGIFSGIGKLLGMQDIVVGYPEFDKDFIIKGNDTEKLKEFFANDRIRELIQKQPRISLEIKDDDGAFKKHFPDGVDEIYFTTVGVIKDVERLKELFELFYEVLIHLYKIGVTTKEGPDVEL